MSALGRACPIFFLTVCLFLSFSTMSSSVSISPAKRLPTAGLVGILTRAWPDGSVTANLTDGDVVLSYKLKPFARNDVEAGIKDCKLVFDAIESRRILNHDQVKIEFLGEDLFADLVDACNKISVWGGVGGIASRILLPAMKSASAYGSTDYLNVPGTKWCGPGDSAKDEDDLGETADVDRCCRSHDLCPYHIFAFQTQDHYWNTRPHTVSSCECDEAFFNCMKGVKENKTVADPIGEAFFDLVGPPCLKKEHGTYCRKWHWTNLWCEATAEGLAAIPYVYLDGAWDKGNSVKEVLEKLGDDAVTPVPPIK